MPHKKATLIGLIAILLWSAIVGLIKSVSEGFGPVGGAALIYSCSAVLLLFTIGFPKIQKFPLSYLIIGSVLFVCYELCLSLSLGFTHSGRQAIEVGMVNYLWPSMTILLAVIVNRQKTSPLIIPGVILAIVGIGRVLGGDGGFSLTEMMNNVMDNPLSYGLAFSGAVIWAIYCVVTQRIAQGNNGITLFFILTALTLWVKYHTSPQPEFTLSWHAWISLMLAAMAMGFGYAAWNVGILHGNVTVLAAASYFIPIISAVLAAFMLDSHLTLAFWQGTAMVSLGSLICWWSTRTVAVKRLSDEAS
ncbi:aromatic amino acid DMT transporter YddG [Enterobacter hormaechei]|jgi:Permeases of the drug/metabolite transporter (DMT) superfamily|uniref:aromatic amino acid DMT transporter YddG n=1 Tax=Enterobacter hormaechei TaxID=158836 RepID=UPI00063C5E56|nr:aromatic amino acid DMT transporter YddG [Enterobacter hormaechei]MBT2006967.1 aromatic amino acid DMT transporter YddG [Enterobacter hormaechei subsp. xiangfangensis]ELF4133183.1 aromatic amino acid DMT transporter YddG [Enterobacter hormaechei]KLF95226.1 aromatic amino acid exporter [Enterobacter hormaechei subsp. steigerwaltii]KZQ99996.1 aromatic amino acid transporter [Enterobacter hormaechei subsp. steigerwaltii]MCJ8522212.1 aromatic amino acid DMT transporter YddG [Enterobacter hormae